MPLFSFIRSRRRAARPVLILAALILALCPAVSAADAFPEALTFTQMRDASMKVGCALKQYDLHKDPVVILMDARHVPNLIATMGILYAGCFYIPLDPASPVERLQVIFPEQSFLSFSL